MPSNSATPRAPFCLALANLVVDALRKATTREELAALMQSVTREMEFRHYALIHHDDLRTSRSDRVDLKDYPSAIAERLFGQHHYRRDPVIRGCIFADSAFLWSDLPRIIRLDRKDRASFELGASEGLNEGITVPYVCLGERMGSCTFAGTNKPDRAERFLGAAQMIGIFAFQSARRLVATVAQPRANRRVHARFHHVRR
jgi:LuxR family quorum-sensing system transcriptional regulator CciR